MNKEVLRDYIDACALVKETQKDIARLQKRKRTIVTGNVKGSMNDFPYAETHFKVAGTAYFWRRPARTGEVCAEFWRSSLNSIFLFV